MKKNVYKYDITHAEGVQVLLSFLREQMSGDSSGQRTGELLKALRRASRRYRSRNERDRRVFFTGFLTGYTAALRIPVRCIVYPKSRALRVLDRARVNKQKT